jgi:hypothetical protein
VLVVQQSDHVVVVGARVVNAGAGAGHEHISWSSIGVVSISKCRSELDSSERRRSSSMSRGLTASLERIAATLSATRR